MKPRQGKRGRSSIVTPLGRKTLPIWLNKLLKSRQAAQHSSGCRRTQLRGLCSHFQRVRFVVPKRRCHRNALALRQPTSPSAQSDSRTAAGRRCLSASEVGLQTRTALRALAGCTPHTPTLKSAVIGSLPYAGSIRAGIGIRGSSAVSAAALPANSKIRPTENIQLIMFFACSRLCLLRNGAPTPPRKSR